MENNDTTRYAVLFSIFLLLLCGVFYFTGLDNWHLWQDEANAALLSKNILSFGYPYVFDGRNVIWPEPSDVSPSTFTWILWSWF